MTQPMIQAALSIMLISAAAINTALFIALPGKPVHFHADQKFEVPQNVEHTPNIPFGAVA